MKNNTETNKKTKYNTLILQNQGAKYKTLFTKKFVNRKKWVKPDEKKIISFIPSTIIKVFVKEGDNVSENEIILSFEAMKMRNIVNSSINGIIKKIYIKEGENVPKGKLMVELE